MTAARRLLLGLTAVALAIVVSLSLSQHASAHALAQSSDPADGATVQSAPKDVVITFGEIPDPRLSTIAVVDTSGSSYSTGPTTAVPGSPLQLEVAVKPLPRGVYTVTWRTVSTVDGHLATGAFAFGVQVAPGAAAAHAHAAVTSPPPSVLAIIGRLLLFAGLVVMTGAVVTALLVASEFRETATFLVAGAWLLVAMGTWGVVESERASAGLSWSGLFSSSLGTTLVWRLIPTVPAGVCAGLALVLRRRPSASRALLGAAGVGAAGAMWADVAASHAGAQAPVAIDLVLQWVHIAAVGVWIGGLLALVLALRLLAAGRRAAAARRFSTIALVCIVVVAASGTVRAAIEVQSWGALTSTGYGQLVLLKAGLTLLLAVLGGLNRFRFVERSARSVRGLRRVASTEVVTGLAVLLVASALVNAVPPAEGAAAPTTPQATSLVVTGSNYATTVKLRLEVSPGTPGFNTFRATVVDYDTGRPVNAQRVVLEFSLPSRPDIGGSTLALTASGPDVFTGSGGNLSIDGAWKVTALVEEGASSTEVDLTVTPRSVPPSVSVSRFPGEPTLYTVKLSQGRSVQVYLDPDKPGSDEFHITFFDAKGNELEIGRATLAVTPPGGTTTVVSLRRLDPVGHFVADIEAPAGSSRYDITATTSSGDILSTYVEVSPGS